MNAALMMVAMLGAAPAADPAVAVLNLEPKNGVAPDVAELLTTNLVATIRQQKHFGRDKVKGTKDLEAIMGFEKQKQLLSCDSQSCMAELAGALGVDFIIYGSLGRLGQMYLFNASLVNVHTGAAEGTVSKRIKGPSEEALLEAVDNIVAELFRDSSLAKPGAAQPAPAAAPQSSPAGGTPSQGAGAVAPASSTGSQESAAAPSSKPEGVQEGSTAPAGTEKKGGSLGKILLGVGAGGLGVAGLGVLVAVAGGVVWGGSFAVLMSGVMRANGRGFLTGLNAASGAGAAVGVVALLAALAAGAAGVGLLGAGVAMK